MTLQYVKPGVGREQRAKESDIRLFRERPGQRGSEVIEIVYMTLATVDVFEPLMFINVLLCQKERAVHTH